MNEQQLEGIVSKEELLLRGYKERHGQYVKRHNDYEIRYIEVAGFGYVREPLIKVNKNKAIELYEGEAFIERSEE